MNKLQDELYKSDEKRNIYQFILLSMAQLSNLKIDKHAIHR